MPPFTAARRFDFARALLRCMGDVANKRKVMIGCLALTSISWMSVGVAAWLVASAAGIDLPYWLMSMVIVAVILFSGVVPAPPGAVGVFEFGVISTLGLFAVDPQAAVTFALVIHATLFLPPIAIGIFVLTRERRTLKSMLAAATSALRGRLSIVTTRK